MHEIQLSTEGILPSELLEALAPYAQEGELTFDTPTTRGGTLLNEIIFAFTTNMGASFLYDALKNLVQKKPKTQIKILLSNNVVDVDVTSLNDYEIFIERSKDITAIKIIHHA